jgi:glycine/D-amino acid oxidase-like deaminating enzyme
MSASMWSIPTRQPAPPLHSDVDCEVSVVGAGVAGLSVSYLLAKEGRTVLVLDRDELGRGETARSTAQLVTALDRGWAAIVRDHGVERARLAAESQRWAIEPWSRRSPGTSREAERVAHGLQRHASWK